MKKILRILLAVVILGIFGYTIYFLYQKSQDKEVIYETANPVLAMLLKRQQLQDQ